MKAKNKLAVYNRIFERIKFDRILGRTEIWLTNEYNFLPQLTSEMLMELWVHGYL